MKITTLKLSLLIVVFALFTSIDVSAQVGQTNKTTISVEIDPATFGFKGYGVHLRIAPKGSMHLLAGFGTYAMDLPELIVDFNKNNKDNGWEVRLNYGYGLFGEYHFSNVHNKWFVGGQLALQEYKIENNTEIGSEKYSNMLFLSYVGHTWQFSDLNIYVKPWAGIGYTSKVSGTTILGNLEYDNAPILMFAALHIGYTF